MSIRRSCELIRKAISDEHEAVGMYRNLLDHISDVADDIDKKKHGEGSIILINIRNIIQDQMRHEKLFKDISSKIGCK